MASPSGPSLGDGVEDKCETELSLMDKTRTRGTLGSEP
jgi:hypothetical protein